MNNEKRNLRVGVLLSLQRALLGAVTTNLRAVKCNFSDNSLQIKAIFDGEISEENEEDMSVVEAEVIADLPEMEVNLFCHRLDVPMRISFENNDLIVYLRKEN